MSSHQYFNVWGFWTRAMQTWGSPGSGCPCWRVRGDAIHPFWGLRRQTWKAYSSKEMGQTSKAVMEIHRRGFRNRPWGRAYSLGSISQRGTKDMPTIWLKAFTVTLGVAEVNFRKGPLYLISLIVTGFECISPRSLYRIWFPHLPLFLWHSINMIHWSVFLLSDFHACWGWDVCLTHHCLTQGLAGTQYCGLDA